MSKIHFISVGGAVMHNLALALQKAGNQVTGSDDEIYEPSLSRLRNAGILPEKIGWYPDKINKDLDYIILGMHARIDNPELLEAQRQSIKIYSFPEFIYEISKNKKRIVVGGSQGKTTTTSMIMWALKKMGFDFDYLVGGNIKGFELMVRISEAPLIVLEGDEYLSSPLDRSPKIIHYKAHLGVLTGIDWDHMNVFPTEANYFEQFIKYIDSFEKGGKLFYYQNDIKIPEIISKSENFKHITSIPYSEAEMPSGYELSIFGNHNRANIIAAKKICNELGINDSDFWKTMKDFEGAEKRLQKIYEREEFVLFSDFAHAPAKLKATVEAVRQQYHNEKLYAFYELHTYSSLNKDFLPQYHGSMDACDFAAVLFNPHTLEMKKMPQLSKEEIRNQFGRKNLQVFDNVEEFHNFVKGIERQKAVFLFMSSGNFGHLDLKSLN